MIECCIAAFKQKQERKLYHAYVTDALKAIAENTSRFAVPGIGMVEQGTTLARRWIEIQDEPVKKQEQHEDTRQAAEIAADIWARIRGN